jgi:hypothetical protein
MIMYYVDNKQITKTTKMKTGKSVHLLAFEFAPSKHTPAVLPLGLACSLKNQILNCECHTQTLKSTITSTISTLKRLKYGRRVETSYLSSSSECRQYENFNRFVSSPLKRNC